MEFWSAGVMFDFYSHYSLTPLLHCLRHAKENSSGELENEHDAGGVSAVC
jgi:hypothetical protein